jgi:hypothetical protein
MTRSEVLADGSTKMELATEMKNSHEKNDCVGLARMRFPAVAVS